MAKAGTSNSPAPLVHKAGQISPRAQLAPVSRFECVCIVLLQQLIHCLADKIQLFQRGRQLHCLTIFVLGEDEVVVAT